MSLIWQFFIVACGMFAWGILAGLLIHGKVTNRLKSDLANLVDRIDSERSISP